MVSNSGSFLIHVPQISSMSDRDRLRTIGRAVVRTAKLLGADIKVSQKRNLYSVWVYYKNGERGWSPIYFDWGKDWSEHEVFNFLRSELYDYASHHDVPVLQSPEIR